MNFKVSAFDKKSLYALPLKGFTGNLNNIIGASTERAGKFFDSVY